MARVRQRVTVTKRTRKYGEGTGFERCKNCGGDGVVKVRKKSSKKK